MNRLSALFTICFLGLSIGCGPAVKSGTEFESASAARTLLLKNYPEIKDPRIERYLSDLSRRVELGLSLAPGVKAEVSSPSFTVVNTPLPIACSLGSNIFVLSTGMITALAAEAELAFVLAHELAHESLGHHIDAANEYGEVNQTALIHESQADGLALEAMIRAGYDPRSAVSALVHAFRAAGLSENYLESVLSERLRNIAKLNLQSGWLPPGTVNRRDFVELQSLVRRFAA